MDKHCKTILWRLFHFSIYVVIGGVAFMQIEKLEDDNSTEMATFEDSLGQWVKNYNISRENITALVQEYERAKGNGQKATWNFINSIHFVLQLITTIGYGNITPVTPFGQIFAIAYAMGGIPITILALQSIGKLVNIGLRVASRPLHWKFHSIHCQEKNCDFLEKGNMCINTTCLILTWVIVSAISVSLDTDRPVVTIVYSIFVTYSTIGFGDFIPFKNHGYVFIIIVLPGLSFMSSSIDSVVAYLDKRRMLEKGCSICTNCLAAKRHARKTTNEEAPRSDVCEEIPL